MRVPLAICIFVTLSFILEFNEANPDPGRRKSSSGGWGSNSKSKSSGSWWGSSNKKNNNNNWGSGNTYKKKGGSMKTLKKAAVIGATAYGAYQLGKLSGSFGGYHHRGHWGYNDWNSWREVDGFMCRNNEDCNWIDHRLYCQDYELDFSPMRAWFGGDFAAIIGECACPHGMRWDDWEMRCEHDMFSFIGGILGLVAIVAGVILCCGCCVVCLIARRFMS